MSITTVSLRHFAGDLATAKRPTTSGQVFVTDRGKPTCALLKIYDYHHLENIPVPCWTFSFA